MGRKHQKKHGRPPVRPASPPAGLVDRLLGLRDVLVAGDAATALAAVEAWLGELGVEPAVPVEAVEAPAAEPVEAPRPAPSISVLMMTWNRADLIGAAIDSVLAQTWPHFELVICDDGSTDATPAVVGRYTDPRVRYVRKAVNEGRSKTRNRLVAEARTDFVLWMADDDELAPDTLQAYVEVLAEDPGLDVLYGKLEIFDHDTGRTLNVYEPNDWGGREGELLGAKLYGSCIPDGGSLVRRALYDRHGAYDPEFVRAQDYEFWTRVAHDIRVRKLDRVVYRYRKHGGNVSFGDFVDLTYDSKIIRRLLTRHPLSAFHPRQDWSQPEVARSVAYLKLARCLRLYQDGYNAARFLAAIPRWPMMPEVVEALFEARLAMGALEGCAAVVDAFAEAQAVRPHRLLGKLRERLAAAVRLRGEIAAAVDAGRVAEADALLQRHRATFEVTFDEVFARGRLLLGVGRAEEALSCFCQAVRLNPTREDAFAAAVALRAQLGASGSKVDVEAMRARLFEALYEPEAPAAAPLPEGGPLVSVLIAAAGDAGAVRQAVASALRQSWRDLEVVVAGEVSGVDDPRVRCVAAAGGPAALRNGLLAAARGAYVAWLEAPGLHDADHVAHLMRRLLAGPERAAFAEARRVRLAAGAEGPEVEETVWQMPAPFDRDRLLAVDAIPLTAVAHARDVEARFDEAAEPYAAWAFVLDLSRGGPLAHVGEPTCEVPAAEVTDRRALQRIYRRHAREALFNTRARELQARLLAGFGVAQPREGASGVVVVLEGLEETRRCVEALLAHTWVPFQLAVVGDTADDAAGAWLDGVKEARPGTRVRVNPRALGRAKVLNQGLGLAAGEYVALVRGDVTVPDGWLGRMQWWAEQAPQTGVVLAAGASAWTPDDRCLVVKRGVLDRVGGFDTTIGDAGLALADWFLRVRLAGYAVVVAEDVPVAGPSVARGVPDVDAAARFARRWGVSSGPADADSVTRALAGRSYDREVHFFAFGAEAGFRPDIRPLTVEEAGATNILVRPPWGDEAALTALLRACAEAGGPTWWLRAAPGEGERTLQRLQALARRAGLKPDALPDLLVVDAPLAPDREGALYVTADAIYVDDSWPDADMEVRRAADCGRPVLRSAAAVRAFGDRT